MTQRIATEQNCEKEGCRRKGYRFFGLADPDASEICLCKKHLEETKLRLYQTLMNIRTLDKDGNEISLKGVGEHGKKKKKKGTRGRAE